MDIPFKEHPDENYLFIELVDNGSSGLNRITQYDKLFYE